MENDLNDFIQKVLNDLSTSNDFGTSTKMFEKMKKPYLRCRCPHCDNLLQLFIDPPHSFKFICSCFHAFSLEGSGSTYRMQDKTIQLRNNIIDVFLHIQSTMTV